MYDLYRRRRAAPNYDEYDPEDQFETLPAPRFPLTERDIPDNFPVEAEAGRASGPDADAQVAATKARLQSLVDDPDYWRHHKPDAVARATKAFEAAYGGGHGTDATGKLIRTDPKPIDFAAFEVPKETQEFGADAGAGGRTAYDAREFLSDGDAKRDKATISAAARKSGKPEVRDLLYRPHEDKPQIHHRPYDPLRDNGHIMRTDWLEQENQNRPPWADPTNPSQADDAALRKPTHREAERYSTLKPNYPDIRLSDDRGITLPSGPTLHTEKERIDSILNNKSGKISVNDYALVSSSAPTYATHYVGRAAVEAHDSTIQRIALAHGVDPDLVRAIMYVENAQGHYLGYARIAEVHGLAKSIFPMNIRHDPWRNLGGYTKGDFQIPEKNIEAAVILLRRMQDRLESPTVAKIATLYNSLSRDFVSDYGARVAEVYQSKGWRRR